MKWTLRQIAKVNNIPLHRLKTVLTEKKIELKKYITIGSRKRIELTDVGKNKLLALVFDRYSTGRDQKRFDRKSPPEILTGHDRSRVEKLEEELRLEKEERNKLQAALLEAQHRHDTIIMSLTNRLEDIQKRLPAPEATQELKVKKKSLWSKFCKWLNEVPEKTE